MAKKNLSPEIVSLIHHVELNESGWWKKAVSQVVRGVLWQSHGPLSQQQIQDGLHQELGIRLSGNALSNQLAMLSSQGSVVMLPDECYKLSEATRQQLSDARVQALAEQNSCHQKFLDFCLQHCPSLEAEFVWKEFSHALHSAVHVTGANLYHLLADGALEKDVDWLASFLSKFNETDETEGLRCVIEAFFSPANQDCRNQVLRLLSAHFFAEASQLSSETISLLERDRKARAMKVVLDTNFIFSVLGLHDNPGDDAALSLLEVAQKSHGKLDIKFYALPITLEEAKRVLINQMQIVSRIRTTRAMARAAITQPLPSVAKKFFDAATKVPGLTAEAFFQPYIDDLRAILQGKGIAILEAHPSVYTKRQDVIDDVQDELSREERDLPEGKRKGYETLLHDAVLWHAVLDRRKEDVDAPFEVEYWAVSMDWRLIAFDRKKRLENVTQLPVVLHPSNLVQLVQFWVPRNKELDNTLIDALRLPLFFQSFDPEDERATVKVLESISRFENVEDLPEKTIQLVLANKALRGRIKAADASNDKVFELVREELLEEHKKTVFQLESAQSKVLLSRQELDAERTERIQFERERNAAVDALGIANEQNEALSGRIADEVAARVSAEGRVTSLQNDVNAQKLSLISIEKRLDRQKYIGLFFVFPLFLGGVAGAFFYSYGIKLVPWSSDGWAKWGMVLGVFSLPCVLACICSPWYCSQRPYLLDWKLAQWVCRVGKKGILAPMLAAGSAIFSGGVWDWVKSIMDLKI